MKGIIPPPPPSPPTSQPRPCLGNPNLGTPRVNSPPSPGSAHRQLRLSSTLHPHLSPAIILREKMVESSNFRRLTTKPRVFITSDICNEPDDAESLVRLLLYSNEFDVCGLVPCTSTWMRSAVHPEEMVKIVNAYGLVRDNLNAHVHPENQYPAAAQLLGLIKSGPPVYGKKALEEGEPLSEGAALLIEQLRASEQPMWVLCWGGANVLAQALQHMARTLGSDDFEQLRSRLRVYTISDQDDTGLWIRVTYPDVLYICSVHGWNAYGLATWTGISGDGKKPIFGGGPSREKVSAEWLRENVQIGPLGAVYPDFMHIMEGDTPTFLYLIQNGLGSTEHPDWGSWGGRYNPVDLGLAAKHYSDAQDRVVGKDGERYTSNHATIWRWRDAYQNDFAARMQWTLTVDPAKVNHAPVVVVNDSTAGAEPLFVDVAAGETLRLDASASYDPDGDELTFTWFHYREPSIEAVGMIDQWVPKLEIVPESEDGNVVAIKMPPPEKCAIDFLSGKPQKEGQVLHVILQVEDSGTPSLTTYRRIVIQVTNRELRGGRSRQLETVTDFLEMKE
jgi:hypothetical protein